MDYSESRQYHTGDDIRNIDWRVTARTGHTHTKVYIEERERPVYLVVSFSSSLYFGTRDTFKSVLAARAAALLAWTAVLGGDRLGGVLIADNEIIDLKPKAGRKGALSMISALSHATEVKAESDQGNQLNRALQHLKTAVHPGSMVFVFSDFYQTNLTTERLLKTVRRHNDVALFNLLDPIEISVPAPGLYAISSPGDTDESGILDIRSKKRRKHYQSICQQRKHRLENLSRACGIPVIELTNGEDLLKTMSATFGRPGRTRQ